MLYRTISELLQPIVQILGTLRFWAPVWGLRDNARCSSCAHWKARNGLLLVLTERFFASCYGWVTTSEKRSQIADFATTRSVWSKISGSRGRPPPPIIFARIVRPVNALQLCRWQFSQRNFVGLADFLQGKCDFRRKSAVLRFLAPPPFWRLKSNVRWSS